MNRDPGEIVRLARRIAIWSLAVLAAGFLVFTVDGRRTAEREFRRQVELAGEAAERLRREVVLFSDLRVPAGVTFSQALMTLGVGAVAANEIVEAVRPVLNPRSFRAGSKLAVGRSVVGEIRSVRYQLDSERMLWVAAKEGRYRAEVKTIPTHLETVAVAGEIRDALFNAVQDAGEGPELALKMAEIFGWDLDFYTDPQPGDAFRVLVEKKKYLDGSTASYGRILAAEYVNAGRPYQAVLFRDPAGAPAYYRPDGQSLQKAFLRSPLKFAARVTSHFSRSRFHPILKIYRPHYGIDYAAPRGTPVQTIGSGRVSGVCGSEGGSGRAGARETHKWIRDDVFASIAHPGEGGAANWTGAEYWIGGLDGAFDGAASGFSDFAAWAIPEFRAAEFAAGKSGRQAGVGRICGGAGAVDADVGGGGKGAAGGEGRSGDERGKSVSEGKAGAIKSVLRTG
jgi:murein DD-endopeptidase MepM/ murein hydrolase activator NlpD